MKREPTEEERRAIANAVASGDKIEAIGLYISIAECGLTEAQNFVSALAKEVNASHPGEYSGKQRPRRNIFTRFMDNLRV